MAKKDNTKEVLEEVKEEVVEELVAGEPEEPIKVSIEEKTRQLRADYSIELQQDLKSVHGLDNEENVGMVVVEEPKPTIQEPVKSLADFGFVVDATGLYYAEALQDVVLQPGVASLIPIKNQVPPGTRVLPFRKMDENGCVLLSDEIVDGFIQVENVRDTPRKIVASAVVAKITLN